jgi:UDP-glucose 4-epimerase
MIKNKKIIVTGGNGFIGSHIVDKLADTNDVHVIDNLSSDAAEKFYYNKNATYHKADITDYEAIKDIFTDTDYVFHLAAEARIQPTLINPILAAKSNMLGTCTVLQCSREACVKRVIYSSTSSAYGLKNSPPLNEEMPNDCLNPYSVTKTGGEELCKMFTNLFDLETVILRYFNVYGDRSPLRGQYAPVVGIFMRQTRSNEPMTIIGDGTQRRDFTHVDDIVEANVRAAESNNSKIIGNTINVGTGTNHSIIEVANMIGSMTVHLPERKAEAKITLANNSRLKEWLDFTPQDRLKEYINGSR